jgi:NADPH:quinone reductase-like Zn-dependent oxidoreductase
MKIWQNHEWGGPDTLQLDDVPSPVAGAGEVRVATRALGLNPVDWKLLTGKAPVKMDLPHVPGGDIAGVVDQIGEGVTRFSVGDRVFGLIGLKGAYAEQVVTSATSLAAIPEGTDFAAAAALPLVSLTALQGMLADGRDLSGLAILVHGGAGGVGSAAIQIARASGAKVTASASVAKAGFVTGLGADKVVDFRLGDAEIADASFDMLVDLVGDSQEAGLWRLVQKGGSVIRVAGGATAAAEEEVDGARAYKVRVKPDGDNMAQIARYVGEGRMKAAIEKTFPFESAVEALEIVKAGHVTGKIVLTVG